MLFQRKIPQTKLLIPFIGINQNITKLQAFKCSTTLHQAGCLNKSSGRKNASGLNTFVYSVEWSVGCTGIEYVVGIKFHQ